MNHSALIEHKIKFPALKEMFDNADNAMVNEEHTYKPSETSSKYRMGYQLFDRTGIETAYPESVTSIERIVALNNTCTAKNAMFKQLQMISNDDSFWTVDSLSKQTEIDNTRYALATAIAQPTFMANWEQAEQAENKTDLAQPRHKHFSKSISPGPHVTTKTIKLQNGTTLTIHEGQIAMPTSDMPLNKNSYNIRRSLSQVRDTEAYFHIKSRRTVIDFTEPETEDTNGPRLMSLIITTTPTSSYTPNAHDLNRLLTPNLIQPENLPRHILDTPESDKKMLCVNALGILNDEIPNLHLSTHKRMSLAEVSWVPHEDTGVHDIHYGHFAMPHIREYANWIGQVHLFTQIGKSILKTRPNPSPEVLAATAEQKGAHLKDEVKLCKYWNTINDLMTPEECKCMRGAISQVHNGTVPIILELKSANTSQATFPVNGVPVTPLNSNRNLPSTIDPVQKHKYSQCSTHHINCDVRIKAALTVPVKSLQRNISVVPTRIDNIWQLEMNTTAYE